MIDINKKLEKIEKNCLDISKKELNLIKQENDIFIEQKLSEMVNSYKNELDKKYENELDKLKREYNRNLFDYEMNEKKQINNLKQNLIDNIKDKIKLEFQNFVNTAEYKSYLFKNVEKVLRNIEGRGSTIFITENDYFKFSEEISETFNMKVDKIDNENIGGCVLININDKISIDNTIKNNIEEEIKQIKF